MPDPLNLSNLFGQSVNDTTGQQPFALTTSGVSSNHSEETSFVNRHGTVDINISLNSANKLSSQYQTTEKLGQLGLHQHAAVSSLPRSNLTIPCVIRAHSTCDPPMQRQNTVNINIAVRNNSSININLLNNNAPSQVTKNNICAHASSSVELVRKNVISTAPANYKQPFPNLALIQESIPNNILEISKSTQLIVCPRKGIASSPLHQIRFCNPCQSIDFQHHFISQSKSNLSFFNLPPGLFHPLPSKATMNSAKGEEINFDGGNEAFQTSLPICSESLSIRQPGTDQFSDPNTKFNRLLPSHLQLIAQAPLKNEIITQSSLAQSTGPNHSTDQDPQVRKRQHCVARYKSHPYIKYGPYTCPECHVTFDSQHCFAAHAQIHYKDESPAKRKKRRESKVRNRDLHITESTSGITIIPGSLPAEEKLRAASNNSGQKASTTNQGEGFAAVKIKDEIITE